MVLQRARNIPRKDHLFGLGRKEMTRLCFPVVSYKRKICPMVHEKSLKGRNTEMLLANFKDIFIFTGNITENHTEVLAGNISMFSCLLKAISPKPLKLVQLNVWYRKKTPQLFSTFPFFFF